MILFKNRFEGQPVSKPHCDCFNLFGPYKSKNNKAELKVHADTQDRECKAWRDLLYLIDETAMEDCCQALTEVCTCGCHESHDLEALKKYERELSKRLELVRERIKKIKN